jgi:hypothetical protein
MPTVRAYVLDLSERPCDSLGVEALTADPFGAGDTDREAVPVSNTLRVERVRGTLIAATFGVMDKTADNPDPYCYAEFAQLGASARFSMPASKMPEGLVGQLLGGVDAEVLITGKCEADGSGRKDKLKLSATSVEPSGPVPDASTNGKVSASATR